jgi:dihydroorotate dehydrogenase
MYYDIEKSFNDNLSTYNQWPALDLREHWPAPEKWRDFLGYRLAVPIGVSACPIAIGEGIRHLARYGYSLLTYKTIRYHQHDAYAAPNVFYLTATNLLSDEDLLQPLTATAEKPLNNMYLGLTNSFGNANFGATWLEQDIEHTKKVLMPGQILNVSIFGEKSATESRIESFAKAASLAKNVGADTIEINFSCPNLKKEMLTFDIDNMSTIAKRIVQIANPLPVIAKLGYDNDPTRVRTLMKKLARAGVRAISGINTIPAHVVNHNQAPIFGQDRPLSGISGFPVRALAMSFIQMINQINIEEKLDFSILGVGGVTQVQDFNLLLEAGADIALSATAVMWNPLLSQQYLQEYYTHAETAFA